MKCRQAEMWMIFREEENLPEAKSAELEKHLTRCRRCREAARFSALLREEAGLGAKVPEQSTHYWQTYTSTCIGQIDDRDRVTGETIFDSLRQMILQEPIPAAALLILALVVAALGSAGSS